jgi:hypothetical protein
MLSLIWSGRERARAGIGLHVNGWFYQTSTVGTYGTAYKLRGMGTLIGLGVNLPEDAVYPASFVDGDGKPYTGGNRYTLHFDQGMLPPAGAFWSVTLYDKDGFQAPNALNRFALGDRDKLKFNADGSLDIYIQSVTPGTDKEANWLPAPTGEFNLAMRLYSSTSGGAGRSLDASACEKVKLSCLRPHVAHLRHDKHDGQCLPSRA